MIDASHALPIVRQAQLLDVSRSSVYYQPQPSAEADLALMRRLDELHLEHPFAGSRMLRDLLCREGFEVGRKHVATLMRKMGIEALYQKPRTSGRDREHPVFRYLLRGMTIERPNQVWAMDTTYIPMRRGFVYLTAVVDWVSRRVLAFRVSISLAADAGVDALKEAIARYGAPEIMNTDQGSQFVRVCSMFSRSRYSAYSCDSRLPQYPYINVGLKFIQRVVQLTAKRGREDEVARSASCSATAVLAGNRRWQPSKGPRLVEIDADVLVTSAGAMVAQGTDGQKRRGVRRRTEFAKRFEWSDGGSRRSRRAYVPRSSIHFE